jgi:ketopantoate hydroxymethyltransferase
MNLELIWEKFFHNLKNNPGIVTVHKKTFTGIPFLYVETTTSLLTEKLDQLLKEAATSAIKGSKLHYETVFVRCENGIHVYRHRFLVPQEKMFCCGNMCKDCFRFKRRS